MTDSNVTKSIKHFHLKIKTKGAFTPDANEENKSCYSRVVGRFNILSLLASFACEIRFIRA